MQFCIFRTVWILDGYNLSGKMEWAQNYDSKSHVKRQNLTPSDNDDDDKMNLFIDKLLFVTGLPSVHCLAMLHLIIISMMIMIMIRMIVR